jgi:hypothetical protein
VALDEFALQSVPDTHYAWAPKNTAPTVPSDERNRQKLNGVLGVDLQRGTTDVDFRAQSKTQDAVVVVVLLVLRYVRRGFRWITVILDNATVRLQPVHLAPDSAPRHPLHFGTRDDDGDRARLATTDSGLAGERANPGRVLPATRA